MVVIQYCGIYYSNSIIIITMVSVSELCGQTSQSDVFIWNPDQICAGLNNSSCHLIQWFISVSWLTTALNRSFTILKHQRRLEMAAEAIVVRDMYEELFLPDNLTISDIEERGKKDHREKMLNQNPDILFRIYSKGKLHVLLFRPTNDSWWIRKLRDQYPGISSQWTFKHADNRPIRHVMNLSGKKVLLEHFCEMFPVNRDRALDHLEEVQELRRRIRNLNLNINDLKLENRYLKLDNTHLNFYNSHLRRTIEEGQP